MPVSHKSADTNGAWVRNCFAVTAILFSPYIAFAWWMSPVGFGFAGVSQDPVAHGLYWLSYFVGIPLLLTAQLAALVLLLMRKMSLAFRISTFALVLFLMTIVAASAGLGVLF
jgi:hypothetical protein